MSHRPRRRPTAVLAAVAVLTVGFVTGCGSLDSSDVGPTATRSPSAGPAPSTEPPAPPVVPDVPVGSADLADQAVVAVIPPVSLRISAQDIELPVDAVGVQADGQMEIPPLAERGGWYRYSAGPGADAGTAVIAAHIDSIASAGLGPFARLKDVAAGDVVEVGLLDGTRRDFSVTNVERMAKTDVRWQEVFARGGPHRLVLITCGGVFQPAVGHYTDNVIVTADPVGGA